MIKPVLYAAGLLFLSVSVLFVASANDPERENPDPVFEFVDAFRADDRGRIAGCVSYPLRREFPIPAIENEAELIERFEEVFDAKLVEKIVGSDPSRDWSTVGWRGIMLGHGDIWLDHEGMLLAVNYQSAVEARIRNDLIAASESTLHQSLRGFSEPILDWKTSSYRVRLDDLGDGEFRYASWSIERTPGQAPDLVLHHGELATDGSGGNHNYTFTNGAYTYRCYVTVLGTSATPPGALEVSRDGAVLLEEPVTEDSRAR